MFKRTCSLLLAIVMVIGLMPMTTMAEETGDPPAIVADVTTVSSENADENAEKSADEAPVCTMDENCTLPEGHTEGCPKAVPAEDEDPLAEDGQWNGETIASVNDLLAFAAAVNAGDTFASKTVTLTADIDLTDVEWTPIGTTSYPFAGEFDGGSYTISNLTMSGTDAYRGLFGSTNNAYLHDLTLKDVTFSGNVEGSAFIGALVGYLYKQGVIEDVHVDGLMMTLKASGNSIGGLVGYSYDGNIVNSSVKNATFNIISTATTNSGLGIGGMVGQGRGVNTFTSSYGNTNTCSYSNCVVEDVTINASGTTQIGGFLGKDGYNHWANSASNCTVTGLNVTCAEGDGVYTVGGFMGGQYGGMYANALTDNSVTGSITSSGTNAASTFGGFLGYVGGRPGGAVNCTANVTIDVAAGDVGGFVGETQQYFAHEYKFENCDAEGDVSTDNGTAGGFIANIQHGGDGQTLNVVITGCEVSGAVNGTTANALVGNIDDNKNGIATGGEVLLNENTVNGEPSTDADVGGNTSLLVYPAPTYAAYIGGTGYATLADAITAANEGDTITLSDGTHTMPNSVANKNITITAAEGAKAVVDMTIASGYRNASGSTIAFVGITAEFGNTTYNGLAHSTKITYTDCVLNGQQTLYATAVEFENCVFNATGDNYSIWTWGATNVTFTNSTFNSDGKAVLVYGYGPTDVTLTDCVFKATQNVGKAAVEIGDDYGATYTVKLNSCTADENFVANKSTSNLWGNKNSMDGEHLNVFIDEVQVYPVVVPTNWIEVADTTWYVEGPTEFTLTTPEQLAGLAKLVNEGNRMTAIQFKLGDDIDLTALEWTPIGLTSETPFSGHFDGQNHTITGLNMASAYVNAGLFGYVKNNTVDYLCSFENVTFNNVTISNATNAGAIFGDAKFAQRHEWYGGIIQIHNVNVTGDVKIDAVNAGAVTGSEWLGVRMAASNVNVNAVTGSYVHGSAVAGGMFASTPHSGGEDAKIEKINSNIDVKGEGFVGGIAGRAAWTLDDLTCTGTVTATGTTNAGTIFGQIVDNNYWSKNVDLVGMTNLNGEGATLTIDGVASTQLFPTLGWSGKSEFAYVEGKVHEKSASVSIDGGEAILMTWPEAMAEIEGKTAEITLTLANGASWTWEYGIKLPADTILTIDLNGKTLEGTIFSEGDLTVKNGSLMSYEFTSAIESYGENAVLTIEDGVTIKSQRHALRIEGGKATINGGVFQTWGRTSETETVHVLNAGGEFATEVTINGGEFRALKYDNKAENPDSSAAVNAQNNATVTINGGKFGYGQNDTLRTSGTGKIIAMGGEYDQDPTAYVADGYQVVAAETEGWLKVVKDMAVAKIGDTKYETIEAAFAAAKDGETVTLLADCTLAKNIQVMKNITLDLNGKSLSVDKVGVYMFMVLADFTITGEGSITATGIDEMFNVGNVKLTLNGNITYSSEYNVIRPGGAANVAINAGTLTSEKGAVLDAYADYTNTTITKAEVLEITAPTGYIWKDGTTLMPAPAALVDEELTIINTALNAEAYIGAQFILNTSAAAAYDSVYVVVEHNGNAVEIRDNIGDSIGYFVYEYHMHAKHMTDVITVTPYGEKNGETYTGVAIEWSVQRRGIEILDRDNVATATDRASKRAKMVANMLNYGAEAQKAFSYNTATLATDNLAANHAALIETSVPVIEDTSFVTDNGITDVTLLKPALGLEDVVQMQAIFKLNDYTVSELEAQVVYNGNVYNVDGLDYGAYIAIVFDEMEAKDVRAAIQITIYEKASGNAVSETYTMSVESAAYGMLDGNYAQLVQALMHYGDASKAYVG